MNVLAQEPGHEVWLTVVALVKNLSEVLVNSLPLFWKVSRGYIDGRLKKVESCLVLSCQLNVVLHFVDRLHIA
jgi:hypothetical protein